MIDRLSAYAPYSLALLRIVSALLFLEAGTVILFGWPKPAFEMPPMDALSWFAGIMELVGGLLLTIGLLTRPTAFILSGMMAVAYWGFHFPSNPWPVNNMGIPAILFCFVFLHLVFAGPGAWALDNLRR